MHDQPELAGQIVLTLADIYGALEDVTGGGGERLHVGEQVLFDMVRVADVIGIRVDDASLLSGP